MALYKITSLEYYSRKRIPAVTLAEIDPNTFAVIKEIAMPADGTFLREPKNFSRRWQIKQFGNLILLGNNYGISMPIGDYLED